MSASLNQIQEMYAQLQELELQLQRVRDAIDATGATAETVSPTFFSLNREVLQYFVLIRRLGLPPDVERALELLQRVLMLLRMMQITVNILLAGGGGGFLALATTAMAGASLITLAGETR
jgi:hypothetical protein